ncbi:MAG: type 4a pilus biogenesis protein PilO [Planctomycetota bacterium]
MTETNLDRSRLRLIDAAGASACIVLTMLTYVVIISPQLRSMKDYSAREQVLMQRSMDASGRADAARRVAARVDNVRRQLDAFPIVLESSTGVNARLSTLSDLATEHGIDIDLLAVEGTRPNPEYTVVPIQLKGTADYASIMKFFHGLAIAMPNTGVASFELKASPGRRADVQMDMQLVWYARTTNTNQMAMNQP